MPQLEYPPRVSCALLPTRIERLARYGAAVDGVEVWIKRDDQTEFTLSGNKVRKLEFSFARALADGVDAVVTCGGVNSNHCRATAFLAARLGLESHLFLRTPDGQAPQNLTGNTLLDVLVGAQIQWITPEQYRERDALLQDFVERQAAAGKMVYGIPEGASDAIGSMGYVHAVDEIDQQLKAKNLRMDYLVHAVGSGGTFAGLSAGRDFFRSDWELIGFPVCDDAATFEARVREIRTDLLQFGLPDWTGAGAQLIDGYQGPGYGLTTPRDLQRIREFCRLEGILLDPCYTGKAFIGLDSEIRKGSFPRGSRILFLHTGGTFGNFSYEDEWRQAISSS